jgi:hypothetical protein
MLVVLLLLPLSPAINDGEFDHNGGGGSGGGPAAAVALAVAAVDNEGPGFPALHCPGPVKKGQTNWQIW